MRQRIVVFTLLLAGGLTLLAAPAMAVTVPVVELIEDGESFAGQEVTVIGELVGDYGFRRDGTMWTQLNSDSYAVRPIVEGGPLRGSNIGIGVRIPGDLADGLDPPGRYRRVGPIVLATGIWKYHDPDRQGESYLDVRTIEIEAPGRDLSEHPRWSVYGSAFALFLIAGVIGYVYVKERDSLD